MKKNIMVFRTHFWDSFCTQQFDKLRNQCGSDNVFLLFDDTQTPFPDTTAPTTRLSAPNPDPKVRTVLTNFNECISFNKLHRSNKEQVESQIGIFGKLCPVDYDFVWFIEYDVYCDGDWAKVFDVVQAKKKTTDFMATKVFEYKDYILWNHWFAITGRRYDRPPLTERVKGFFPIVRISTALMKEIHDNMGVYSGFSEVYIPTLTKQRGLTYGNLPDSIIGPVFDFFLEKNVKIETHLENKLYHPVVSMDFVD